jgi:hypothetical protein
MKRLATLAFLLLVANQVVAAQFGLESGASLEQIKAITTLKQVKPFVYSASKVPNGHAAFDDYRLLITPNQGLCKIVAWTPAITSNSFGETIKSKFSELFNALTEKYGNSKTYDFLREGSIWDDPQDWMMGLAKGDRTLTAYWDDEEKSSLPPDVESISLEAVGANSETGGISLTYEFKNFGACSAWIKTQENSSL